MGFWQGIAQGYKDETAERTQDRRIEEERAFQRDTFNNKILEERRNAMIPLILEQRQAAQEEAQQREVWGNFFKGRLGGVDEQTRDAFINIATARPGIAKSLAGSVQSIEEDTGVRVEGQQLVNFANVIEQTKPEGLSTEEWTTQAAGLSVASGSGIDLDATVANLLEGKTLEDLYEVQFGLYDTGETLAVESFEPDIDVTAVRGIEPSDYNNLKDRAYEMAESELKTDLASTERELLEFDSEEPPEYLSERRQELELMLQREDSREIFENYAPRILPDLLETDPRFEQVFPSYFQGEGTITYELINGDLVLTSGNQ